MLENAPPGVPVLSSVLLVVAGNLFLAVAGGVAQSGVRWSRQKSSSKSMQLFVDMLLAKAAIQQFRDAVLGVAQALFHLSS